MKRSSARALGLALALVAIAALACRSEASRRNPADALIEKESDPEVRKELEAVRDATDEEMRAKIATLDAEIARLKKENEELREQAGR